MDPLRPHDPPTIGPHTLLARLGSGGMGQVYLGRSPGGRQLAIKVIREDFAQSGDAAARFRREVETVRAVRSAYTANLVDASLESAPYWLATEYVPGPTLTRVTGERGPLPAETCFRLFAALAEALAQVHEHGITHRDLKPHNIILSPVGPKLIDFGIARGAEQTALTRTGVAAGTPGYTAPEVITRNEVTFAADVFALGATIACAATGRPPYGEGSLESVVYRVVHGEVDVDGVEPRLAELVRACTAADPGARPALSEVIGRCGVTSSLVDDPVYRGFAELGERAPEDVSAAVAAGLIPQRPVGAAGAAGGAYTPTYAPTYVPPQPPEPSRRRSRRGLWIGAGAGSVALGVVIGLVVALPDDGDRKPEAGAGPSGQPAAVSSGLPAGTPGPAGKPSGAPRSSSSASAPPTGAAPPAGPKEEPKYIEATNPNRDFWSPAGGSGMGSCNMPSEERSEYFQAGIPAIANPAEGPVVTADGGGISFRLKYADPKLERPYYVSVAVKPPHEIDPSTGKASRFTNLGMGYTSTPVDLFAGGDPTKGVELKYPDDFRGMRDGKPSAPAVPFHADPGDWTVIFYHVKGPKEYASVMCRGFTVR
ncbi:serine/threonine protein kinase [Streptomyces mobaraensis NBRC 13819 = DSM 40847]|uniref:Serine/threonine protein kinase n=1 Tax=Streptomyces mobaraensis (strain ATCC 29032 / DSM 40847 / JCM 4168 / NBRC 13819 / NCIMB 11159 / IPCR 16-22) TaxID=1223523 RepID=M3BXQ4_STRM1|nr:serine/threonine-protein kinase [Streptomyces mobaraensis]EME96555.1 serine/threonine protein kinase [Streptomyces mobaraensis NBRC 13819 = DSM 40847]QTT75079.1 serine/threonine protein kinase [Streptomyces mobaraensis NBRC 13819 = DSM 40847]